MKAIASVALCLALVATASAQTNNDVTALQGLQSCIQASKGNIAYLNGWGGGVSTGSSSAGRKMLQTSENCAQAAAISSAIPCTPTTPTTTSTTPTTPTTPTYSTPTLPASPPTPSTPTGTSSSSPCGDSSNPVPWTGLLCTNGRVTSVIISQLGPNIFQGSCNVGNLSDLAGLSAVQQVDFTAAGLSGTVPAAWSTGAWSGSLLSLVLAQNPLINGSVPDISGLTALQSLDLSNSSFSGSIPTSFNSTTSPSLLSYTAFSNQISGPLPASLPANLTTFGLGNNKLNGTLPSYTSSTLSTFQVQNNTLTGCLPANWTTGLTNLTTVDLSSNQLAGAIPSTWQASGAFPKLQTINLSGNQFCGSTGQLGTPVGNVGQNNPSATRLVPSVSFAACSGNQSC